MNNTPAFEKRHRELFENLLHTFKLKAKSMDLMFELVGSLAHAQLKKRLEPEAPTIEQTNNVMETLPWKFPNENKKAPRQPWNADWCGPKQRAFDELRGNVKTLMAQLDTITFEEVPK